MKTLLRNCVPLSLTGESSGPCDIRVDGDVITGRGRALRPAAGEDVVDCGGRFVIPGLVCAHTHLYSSLSRGMPPPGRPPATFTEILRRIWWKLDAALDPDSIYYSAMAGGLEALRHGTTTIVDHHAS
ncbi:MAG TPA: amidohydrolase family protein, partial [Bacteroidota bacterium]|nr:amidohydrolase family protein [Bacteroidota bacterium]